MENIVVIANNNQKSSKKNACLLTQQLMCLSIPHKIIYSTSSDYLTTALNQLKEGCYTFVVVGGDGLVSCIANHIMTLANIKESCLTVCPSGTSNSFAYTVGIHNVQGCVNAIRNQAVKKIDIANITFDGKRLYAISILHIGLSVSGAQIAERLRFLGKLRYKMGTIFALLFYRDHSVLLKMNEREQPVANLMMQLTKGPAISNKARILLAPNINLTDGFAEIIYSGFLSLRQRIQFFRSCVTSSHNKLSFVFQEKATQFTVKSNSDITMNVDGEFRHCYDHTIQVVIHKQELPILSGSDV